jgi:monovalent cation:H+ antiporter-2, CPA2 family
MTATNAMPIIPAILRVQGLSLARGGAAMAGIEGLFIRRDHDTRSRALPPRRQIVSGRYDPPLQQGVFLQLGLFASPGPRAVLDLLAILSVAALVNLGFRRLKLATIPGYLITGAVIGPYALGLVRDPESVEGISRLAVIFLMFGVGLSLDLDSVRARMVPILLMGIVSTVLVALLGWPIAMLFGFDGPAALAIAMAMTMSSTAVTLRILQERKEIRQPHARVCIGVSVVQDISSLLVLASLPLLAAWGGVAASVSRNEALRELFVRSLIGLAGVTVLVLIARRLLPRLLREAARGATEVMLVLSAAIALGAAVFTSALGLSPELGAFVGGFMLSSTAFRFQISGQLAPTRDLFMAVFFTTVGLAVNPAVLASAWWVMGLGVLALIILKWSLISVSVWAFGSTAATALLVGAVLAQAGEFTLVLLAAGQREGLFTHEQHSMLVGVAVASLVLVPALYEGAVRLRVRVARVRTAPWIGHPLTKISGAKDPPAAADGSRRRAAIIAGFGPVGRAVADVLQREDVSITVIELNPRTVERQVTIGRRVVYGDASNPEVLEAAGLATCDLFILALPDEDATLRACQTARKLRGDIFISARVTALSKAIQAMQLGADHTVIDELATAEAMSSQLLTKLHEIRAGSDTGPKLYSFDG